MLDVIAQYKEATQSYIQSHDLPKIKHMFGDRVISSDEAKLKRKRMKQIWGF